MSDTVRHAFKWVCFWISLSMLLCVTIYFTQGKQLALEYLGGYLIEFSLSMDNLFVFITLFTAFGVPVAYQHRCLTYGIIGAMVLRLIFISLGVAIVESFTWILYLFGALLIISGMKMFKKPENHDSNPQNSKMIQLLGKIIPITPDFQEDKFFHRIDGKRHATPLFAVLLMIECSDVLFAIDSVPAVFSVSTNLFIVYSSNIFAILGLRQLYFVLEHLQERFRYVRYGVAAILTFTGIKLLVLVFDLQISIVASISIIFAILL
ncbi:MAG: TerC/Alx family metal homeostasis membrane protein, partial [Clostridiales bacterium]